MASAIQFTVSRCDQSTATCDSEFDGIFSGIARPRKSRTCESAMIAAMPLVKPMTMATGTKRTSVPIRSAPMAKSNAPAIIVAMSRSGTPYLSAMA